MSSALFRGLRCMWMPTDLEPKSTGTMPRCCGRMSQALEFSCDQHSDPFECADALVIYHEAFDEYGLIVHDGGASYVLIQYCPWCGAMLPESLRDLWFETLEGMGIADPSASNVPPEFLTAAWRTATPPKET